MTYPASNNAFARGSMLGGIVRLGRMTSDFSSAKCSSDMRAPRLLRVALDRVAFAIHSQHVSRCCSPELTLHGHIGACRTHLTHRFLPTCDRKKRFMVHGLRKIGIRLQLHLYRAPARDMQWFFRCGLLLRPSPEHGCNHGWRPRIFDVRSAHCLPRGRSSQKKPNLASPPQCSPVIPTRLSKGAS